MITIKQLKHATQYEKDCYNTGRDNAYRAINDEWCVLPTAGGNLFFREGFFDYCKDKKVNPDELIAKKKQEKQEA